VNLIPGKLTGWDAAKHARELIPELPVVYMIGAAGTEWASMGVPKSILLTKPFAAPDGRFPVAQFGRFLNANSPISPTWYF
jgi:hypothetical protein